MGPIGVLLIYVRKQSVKIAHSNVRVFLPFPSPSGEPRPSAPCQCVDQYNTHAYFELRHWLAVTKRLGTDSGHGCLGIAYNRRSHDFGSRADQLPQVLYCWVSDFLEVEDFVCSN